MIRGYFKENKASFLNSTTFYVDRTVIETNECYPAVYKPRIVGSGNKVTHSLFAMKGAKMPLDIPIINSKHYLIS